MELSNTASQIISLFLIMIVGFIMKKKHVIDDEAIIRYMRLILNVTLLAQIIKAFVSNQGTMSNFDVLKVFGYSVAMFAIYTVIGILFISSHEYRKRKGESTFCSICSGM